MVKDCWHAAAGGRRGVLHGLDGGVLGAHHAEQAPERIAKGSEPATQVAAGVSCVGWMAVSSGLIMLNKHLMSTDGFHFPMGLSLLGMGFSSIASYIACRACPQP